MDPFAVPTVGFDLLYAFVIVGLGRRELVWISVTANPTAERIARQLTKAFTWEEAPATSSAIGIASMAPSLNADLGWTAPSIRPDMIFGKDKATYTVNAVALSERTGSD